MRAPGAARRPSVPARADRPSRPSDPSGVRIAHGGRPPVIDVVLVDAPCSATGTWRRSPDRRFTFDPAAPPAFTALQRALVVQGAALLKPGGPLVYATCSVLREENADVAAALPEGFTLESCRTLSPHNDGTDGFYWAVATRGADPA